jgi:hypothetical protein
MVQMVARSLKAPLKSMVGCIDYVMSELVMSYFAIDLSSGLVRMAARSLKASMKSMVSVLLLTSCLSL